MRKGKRIKKRENEKREKERGEREEKKEGKRERKRERTKTNNNKFFVLKPAEGVDGAPNTIHSLVFFIFLSLFPSFFLSLPLSLVASLYERTPLYNASNLHFFGYNKIFVSVSSVKIGQHSFLKMKV